MITTDDAEGGDHRGTRVARRELLLRTLQITEPVWEATMAAYHAELPAPAPGETPEQELQRCLGTLTAVYRRYCPHRGVVAESPASRRTCPACRDSTVAPFLVRGHPPDAITYGKCRSCGHGLLWDAGRADVAQLQSCYTSPCYYQQRDLHNVGYDGYAGEAAYREAKGERLVARLRSVQASGLGNLLEVGSGFGFTRAACERAGLATAGIDLNPEAVRQAHQRYGFATFAGTLRGALHDLESGITRGTWDVVLYQFVLEHVVALAQELYDARAALRVGGLLVLLLPSMEAAEIDVFGASYRSFRADHIHLPTQRSLRAILQRAGFAVDLVETECHVHLFHEMLSAPALQSIYSSGRGPDLFVIARRTS